MDDDALPPPPGSLTLRPRRPDDHEHLLDLYAATRADEMARTGWSAERVDTFLRAQFAFREESREAAHPGADLSVVELDGHPVGQLDVDRMDDEIRLLEIVLAPGQRGRGLGTVLFGALVAEAEARAVPLRLHVEATNPARALYERAGLRVVAEHGLHLAMERPPSSAPPPPEAAPPEPPPAPDPPPAPSGDEWSGPGFDLAQLTAEAMRPLVGDRFEILGTEAHLELVAVDPLPGGTDHRQAFALLFHGPLDTPLEQGLHPLVHPERGLLDLFLVPLGPRDGAARYEAIFT